MSKAIRFHEHGGPEVLRWETLEAGRPNLGEVLVRHSAVGLNFSDVLLRKGMMPAALPSGMGFEAAGVVEEVGRGVESLKPGDRVAYFLSQPGAYSQLRICRADSLLKLPDDISGDAAAASLGKGLTAHYLLTETAVIDVGDTIVIHAAAGGVGLIASQWAKHLGATVIGVVGAADKAALAKAHGCDHVFLTSDDLPARVREITGGIGASVVYDSVGKDTFMASLDCLKRRGLMVSFGNASGPPPAISPMELMKRGSLYLTRPGGADYFGSRDALEKGATAFFTLLLKGAVKAHIGQRYPLADAATAHRDLEARKTIGSTILIP